MKKVLKWILGSLVVLVLGIAILIGVLLFVIDPNTFKPTIEKIADNYSLKLNLKGDIDWQFYPNIALKLKDVDVKNTKLQKILYVDELALSVKLLPLLKLDIQVDGIFVKKPQIFYTVDAKSRSNIQDVLDKFKSDDKSAKQEDVQKTKSNNNLKIFITDLEIINANLFYENLAVAKNKQSAQLSNLNVRAAKISLKDYFPLSINGALVAKLPMAVDLNFKLDSLVKAQLNKNKYSLKDLVLDLNIAKPLYTKNPLGLNFKGAFDLDLNSADINLQVSSIVKSLQLQDIATNNIEVKLNAKGNFKSSIYEIDAINLNTAIKSPTQKTNTNKHAFSLVTSPLKVNLNKQTASATSIKLNYAGAKLDLSLLNVRKFSPLNLRVNLDLKIQKLREFLKNLEINLPKMADEKNTLRFLNATTSINLQNNFAKLLKLNTEFDDSKIFGALGYGLKNSYISGNLHLDKINADRYLAPVVKNPQASSAATKDAKKSTGNEKVLPIATLQKLNIDFSAFIEDIIVKNLKVQKLDLALSAKKGLLKIDKLNAKLYEGSFVSKLVVNASKTPVTISINENLSKIQLKPILKDLDKKEMVNGALSLKGGYLTQGNSINEWKANLGGEGELIVDKGAFIGTNIPKLICLAGSALSKMPKSSRNWGENTDFNKLNADVKINKGLIQNTADIAIDGLEVTGKGFYSLPVTDFSYNLGIRLLQDADQKSCHINNQMTQIRWPLTCRGNLAGQNKEWGCSIDVESLARDLAKAYLSDEIKQAKKAVEKTKQEAQKQVEKSKKQLEDNIKKETDKLKEEGKKAIQDALKGLF